MLTERVLILSGLFLQNWQKTTSTNWCRYLWNNLSLDLACKKTLWHQLLCWHVVVPGQKVKQSNSQGLVNDNSRKTRVTSIPMQPWLIHSSYLKACYTGSWNEVIKASCAKVNHMKSRPSPGSKLSVELKVRVKSQLGVQAKGHQGKVVGVSATQGSSGYLSLAWQHLSWLVPPPYTTLNFRIVDIYYFYTLCFPSIFYKPVNCIIPSTSSHLTAPGFTTQYKWTPFFGTI